jgi:aspartate carbamoyltransferase catalytic subunit
MINNKEEIKWKKKHLLGLEELSKEEIKYILQTARSFKEVSLRPIKKVPTLRGKTVAMLFFEPSTRTRTSFELAAKRLSADTINLSISTSSVVKGENLKDTARNIEAMNVDIMVIRHSASGAPHYLAENVSASVVNAGDGCHEHPTQALLDLFTIKEKKGTIEGLKVGIIGDIIHSRVARSNIWGLKKLGAEVILCGPPTMLPLEFRELGVDICYDLKELLSQVDVINILRIQKERIDENLFPSFIEYAQNYGINREKLKYAKKELLILHPGPVNRGIELACDVLDEKKRGDFYTVVLEQVTNGLAIRMAVLYLLTGQLQRG